MLAIGGQKVDDERRYRVIKVGSNLRLRASSVWEFCS